MAVPEYIRMVPRPVNTIVEDNGRDGPNRFAVRERVSIKYISGGNPQPKNGKVIGHIRDGKYVPKQDKASVSVYISDKLTILHGQSDHLSRRFRSLISERDSRRSKSFL